MEAQCDSLNLSSSFSNNVTQKIKDDNLVRGAFYLFPHKKLVFCRVLKSGVTSWYKYLTLLLPNGTVSDQESNLYGTIQSHLKPLHLLEDFELLDMNTTSVANTSSKYGGDDVGERELTRHTLVEDGHKMHI